jgi:hypothetical protein
VFTFSTFYLVHFIVKPTRDQRCPLGGERLLGLACELRRFRP